MSPFLLKFFLTEYVAGAIIAAVYKQWGLVLYFSGSAVLTIGVMVIGR
jgi:hypothetical protein